MREYKRCLKCGKRLLDSESRLRGYGKLCWEEHLKELSRQKRLIVTKKVVDNRTDM